MTPADWIRRAEEVAPFIAAGAIERDRLAAAPREAFDLLKEAGIVSVLGDVADGGGGLIRDWATTNKIVRTISGADGSVGQILGWHYQELWLLYAWGTPEQAARWLPEFTRNRWLATGVINILDKPLAAVDEGDSLVLNGRKTFNTGVAVGDVVIVSAGVGDDEPFLAIAPPGDPGFVIDGEWDTLGQRASVSAPVRVENVRIPWVDVVGYDATKSFVPRRENSTAGLVAQLQMANIYLGIAQGALAHAIKYTRENSRAWFHSEYERAVDEPHILDTYGELHSKLIAVEALVDRAGLKLNALLDDFDSYDLDTRAPLACEISACKLMSTEVGLELSSRVFELTGARSTAKSVGLDRYWRDLRTHSLHDPVAYKRRQVGAYLLRDEPQSAEDWYS